MGQKRSLDLLASLGVHGAFGSVVAVAVALHPLEAAPQVVTMEIVKAAPSPPAAPREAPLPPLAPGAALAHDLAPATPVARRAVHVPKLTTAAAVAMPAVDDSTEEAAVPNVAPAAPLGDASGVSFAPPPPPPPPPAPHEVTRADVDASFVDSGYVRLETLVVSWQHNDGVRGCIEHTLGSGEQIAQLSQSAHDRMLDAVRRGDHAAALAEARRVHDAAQSFDALYRRARRCLQ